MMPSLIVVALCITAMFSDTRYGFLFPSGILNAAMYHFYHCNIFHLAANCLALFQFRPRLSTLGIAYLISSAAAFVPFCSMDEPTYGLSGLIMACTARWFAQFKINPYRLLLINMLFIFVPLFNWKVHLFCFLVSYLLWLYVYRKKYKS